MTLSVVRLSVVILSVVGLSVVILSVVKLSVVRLSVRHGPAQREGNRRLVSRRPGDAQGGAHSGDPLIRSSIKFLIRS